MDETGAGEAIAAVTEVSVDASASSGSSALSYSIDFGDGVTATGTPARHVYSRPGTFTVRVEARDAAGRTATDSATVTVRALDGSWFHAGYIEWSHRVEVRQLTITAHEGSAVRGSYRVTGDRDRVFTGTVTRPRRLQLAVDNGMTLTGDLPPRLDQEVWSVQFAGDPAIRAPLEFRPIVGRPEGDPPDANFRVRFDSLGSTRPILGLSQTEFDGTHSRGTQLMHFIEFGDDAYSTGARVRHRIEKDAFHTARLTVVDRFGRSDSESLTFAPFSIGSAPPWGNWYKPYSDENPRILKFRFDRCDRCGPTWAGEALRHTDEAGETTAAASATLSGERDITIVVPAWNVRFTGHVIVNYPAHMLVTQTGGRENGATWRLLLNYGD